MLALADKGMHGDEQQQRPQADTTTPVSDGATSWWIVNDSARSLYHNEIIPASATRVGKRARLLRFALNHAGNVVRNGQYLEFGVHEGNDLVRMSAFVSSKKQKKNIVFHGFDSFQGLPEDWNNGQQDGEGSVAFGAGTFDLRGVAPRVSTVQQTLNLGKFQESQSNIVLHPGWFQDTIPAFLDAHPAPIAFVHADADLYSSTITFLDAMCQRRLLVRGSVIVFDEYTNYEHWEEGEHRAWREICQRHGIEFDYLCYHAPGPNDRKNTYGYQSVGVVVSKVGYATTLT